MESFCAGSADSDAVKGEPLMEIETDKAAVEIRRPPTESCAALPRGKNIIPIGQPIAHIHPGERQPVQLRNHKPSMLLDWLQIAKNTELISPRSNPGCGLKSRCDEYCKTNRLFKAIPLSLLGEGRGE
jgi:hypothetical protein